MKRVTSPGCLYEKQGIIAERHKKYMEVGSMKEIYHNMKVYALILLISAVCINLGITEDFSRMVIYLTLFFHFFTKWKLKKITSKQGRKTFFTDIFYFSFIICFFNKGRSNI